MAAKVDVKKMDYGLRDAFDQNRTYFIKIQVNQVWHAGITLPAN